MKKILALIALICGLWTMDHGLATAQNVGVDVATPVEKLDVLGAIHIGTTTNTNAGTIRWDGTNFQGYNGTIWVNLSGGTGEAPTGTIVAYGGTTIPTGWLLCDGTSYTTSGQGTLFTAIAYNFGGSGTNFNIPDLRGRFLRGMANGIATDPDRATRTAMAAGGNTGDAVGSVQTDAFQGHFHAVRYGLAAGTSMRFDGVAADRTAAATNTSYFVASNPIADGTHGTPRTSAESRPQNAYVNYIIKN
ncbi:MAG: phage tail protein [Bacteroidia bacterium]